MNTTTFTERQSVSPPVRNERINMSKQQTYGEMKRSPEQGESNWQSKHGSKMKKQKLDKEFQLNSGVLDAYGCIMQNTSSVSRFNSPSNNSSPRKSVGLREPLDTKSPLENTNRRKLSSITVIKHRKALRQYCRKCGQRLKLGLLIPIPFKKVFPNTSKEKDFTKESCDLYPNKLCLPCIGSICELEKFSTDADNPIQLATFQPHNENCVICRGVKDVTSPFQMGDVKINSVSKIDCGSETVSLSNILTDEMIKVDGVCPEGLESNKHIKDVPGNSVESVFSPGIEECEMFTGPLGVEENSVLCEENSVLCEDNLSCFRLDSLTNVFPDNSCVKVAFLGLVESDGTEGEHPGNEKSCSGNNDELEVVGKVKQRDEIDSSHIRSNEIKTHDGRATVTADQEDTGVSATDSVGSDNNEEISIPLSQVIASQKKIAEVLSCYNCESVPLVPYVSKCLHVFCKVCLEHVIEYPSCSKMGASFTHVRKDFHANTSSIYKTLVNTFTFNCKNNCSVKGAAKKLLVHQKICAVKEKGEDTGGDTERKMMLKIENFFDMGDNYCETNRISLEILLFSSLRRCFKLKGDKRRVALLMRLWKNESSLDWQLSPEDCLTLKTSLGLCHDTYRRHYNFLKKRVGVSNLRSPKQIEQVEKMLYPPFTNFSVESQEGITLYKSVIQEHAEPSDIGGLFSCRGFRWKFTAAVAKTLQELVFEFQDKLTSDHNAQFVVSVCDKYEKVGSVKLFRLSQTFAIPKYFIRYSFRISSISLVETDHQKVVLYKNEKSDSISMYRPVAVALPSQHTQDNIKLLLHPIEEEKRNLSGKLLCVRLPNGMTGKFCLRLSSVINYGNERRDLVSLGNFDVNEYGTFCTLCQSDRNHWLENFGMCCIPKDKEISVSDSLINPLQFDLNFIKLFNDVLIRETSQVYSNLSNCTLEEKLLLKVASDKMNEFMLQNYNMQPDSLILEPEDYASKFFSAWSHSGGVEQLISNPSKLVEIRGLYGRYSELRLMYRSILHIPKICKESNLYLFKSKALHWIKYMWRRYPFVAPSSYLHALVEHGQELLLLGCRDASTNVKNEANALNPKVKSVLVETLKNQWLGTSPFLQKRRNCHDKTKM